MQEDHKDIEHYEKRFGVAAVRKGFIRPEDVVAALGTQVREDLSLSRHRLIGQILMDQDLMSPGQIEEVLTSIFREKNEDSQ